MTSRTKTKAFKHVQAIKRHDKSGRLIRVEYYHRKAKVRLPDDYGSPEFAVAWARAEASLGAAPPAPPSRGTYGNLVDDFRRSPDWESLRGRTRADYTQVIDWMFAAGGATASGCARKPARDLDQAVAEKIIERAIDQKWHRFAVYVLQFNRRLYNWSCERAARKKLYGEVNPWRDIRTPKPASKPKGYRPWTPDELRIVLERAPLGLARAYALGASGFDGGTAYLLTWDDYKDGVIDNPREKTDVEGESIIWRPLRPFLDQGPRPSGFIVTNANDVRFETINAFRKASSEFLNGLRREGVVAPGLTMHGLRHTVGKAIAESGGEVGAIQAALRHATERMASHYSRHASRVRALHAVHNNVADWLEGES